MKTFFSLCALALTFGLYVPYIRSMWRAEIEPHVFSWIIWGLGTFIVFFAQLAGGGGVGAWPIGISGAISFYVAWLAFRQQRAAPATATDWAFLALALLALPFWFFTSDPLWAVVTLTLADLLGFGPTIARAWRQPFAESASFFALTGVRNGVVVLALERFTPTTVLFPTAVGVACVALALLLVWRRRAQPRGQG